MSNDGYTPIFGTVFDGSLYGKWPESAVWLTLLALCDKRGNVDMSFQAIAGRTGWPMDLLVQGVGALMQPDPNSRSPAHDGRRLIPLTEGRSWGWHVVNHAVYREKARLQSKDAARTSSGEDAARKRLERGASPEVPRSPPDTLESPEVPLSDADTNTSQSARKRASRVPIPFPITEDMRKWASVNCPHVSNVDGATDEFVDYWRGVSGRHGVKLDWEGTWRNRLRELEQRAGQKNGRAKEASEWR